MTPPEIKVEMYKLANRLKQRMGQAFQQQGDGFLAPSAIEEADKLIAEMCVTCPQTIEKHLQTLSKLWEQMRANPVNREAITEQVFATSHEIKDVGSMCGYALIAHFAESLRDYIESTDLNLNAQIVIVQAHLDAMQVVHRSGFRTNAGPEAEELKLMVQKAIDKYQ